ncbi:hypothetical protein FIBSPDRAFT_1052313 [Athelia psychrophila]|uniref:Uncharacterized protein n=1 Tax=Athelia psychrophila TaxID=1759441 RepID=A0A165XI55_9AGAM|nr:hypothetical protein FIBSPDRAFT_1052313 [Fibularhizoctonia sp. CBS 109695]
MSHISFAGGTRIPHPHYIPVSRFPHELLAEILLLCASLRYDSVTKRNYALFPSHVCRHWRSTALSTPALWTFILFQCEREADIIRESDCARVWLSRSAQRPLSIEVVAGVSKACSEAALRVVTPHCTRWKAITSVLPMDPHIWCEVAGSLPLLESANLSYGTGEAFAIAPRLRHLQLQLEKPPRFVPVKLPWTQLVHLELNILDNYGRSHIRMILQQASNIASLKICAFRRTGLLPESTILTLPNISTFEILGDDDNLIKWFLDGLVLPGLRVLSLPEQWICATSLLSRSGCNLSSFDIHINNMFGFLELGKLPRNNSLPNLLVRVERVDYWNMVVRSLTYHRGVTRFSNLRSLEMSFFVLPTRPVFMDRFADMVESRWRCEDLDLNSESPGCSKLNRVKLVVLDDVSIHRAAIARLRTFAAEGLNITIYFGIDQEQLI